VEEKAPPRSPEQNDLTKLCAALNAANARYIVVGGMAIIQQGFLRATEDIDLLLERSRANQRKVLKALEILPDKSVKDLAETDLDEYLVVRVADEIVVDLMLSACGVTYDEVVDDMEIKVIEGVSIPFASASMLLKMKQTYRDKDIPDRIFLEEKLREETR
jgi:thiamine pyrophosphate-dependent acetolactate synthase large subunit-like protein